MSEMNTANILASLAELGFQDMPIKAVWKNRETGDLHVEEMSLAKLCGERSNLQAALAERLGIKYWDIELRTDVQSPEGNPLGHVDCDGRFHYLAGTMEQILGWAAATDWGRTRPLRGYNLVGHVQQIRNALPTDPGENDFYSIHRGTFSDALKKALDYEYGSRFSDGFLGYKRELWAAAYRERGITHTGYSFAY